MPSSRATRATHGRSAGSGATTHACGDEHHVRPDEVIANLVDDLFGGGAADIGLRTRAETSARCQAHLDDAFGPHRGQRLGIGIGNNEVDAREPGIDHVVDGVTARAADAKNSNPRLQFADAEFLRVEAHGLPLNWRGIDRQVCRRSVGSRLDETQPTQTSSP
jgi:hypothetical protein